MRVIVVGRDNTEYAREMFAWMADFERETKVKPELLDPDSREGESFCRAYDVVEYPSVVVVEEEMGRMLGMWRGKQMAPVGEVAYVARS